MIDYILLALSLLGTWGSFSLMRGKMITKFTLLFFLWIILIMTLGFGVAHYFTGEGTNEAFFYHVFVGVDGTAYTGLGGVFFVTIIAVICGIWLSIFLIKRKSDKRIKIWGYLLACISIFLHPFCQGYLDYRGINPLTNIGILGSDFSQHFVSLDKENISLGNGKNIIYIYLESLENNYLDEEIFPGLTPYLNELRKNAVNFSHVEQLVGTGFTMAGKVASQCGIPLITPGGGNSMGGMDTYLPGATCIGDILKHIGYSMTYSGGASLVFGGKGDFYRSHGFDIVRGKEEFEGYNRLTHNDWGLYDEDLFNIILPELIEKHNSGKPFGYFTITVDTHNPHGFISKKCTKRYTKEESILNAVHCSDELVGTFVEKLKTAGVLKNSVLIIGSDHLAMPNDATEKLNTKERHDSLMMLDGDRTITIDRAASTMDIGPTILYLLGIEVDGLGFGRNLFDTAPTLNEKFENPREALRWKRELKEFWSFPNLEGTIHIKTEQEKISIDGREIDFPVLMHLGRKTRVENMWFQFDSPEKLGQFYQELDESAKIFWVDTCDALREKIPNTPNMKYCLAEGIKKNISAVGILENFVREY